MRPLSVRQMKNLRRRRLENLLVYNVVFKKSALDDLKSMDRQLAAFVYDKIMSYLSSAPLDLGKSLKGAYDGLYSYRIKKCRVIYSIDKDSFTIKIFKVGLRKDVYD
jgi:mRNA-degrading endonuclease RelE of RelBE toxin-antitoxin system